MRRLLAKKQEGTDRLARGLSVGSGEASVSGLSQEDPDEGSAASVT